MATYYVKNGGSDLSSGADDANAWANLSKVASTAGASDTVLFKCGSTWTGPGGDTIMFTLPASGITLGFYGTGAPPVFDVNGGANGIITGTRNNITIRGLKVTNGGTAVGALISLSGDTTGHLVEDCIADGHSFDSGIALGNGATGTVQGCTITNCADEGFTMHGLTGKTTTANVIDCIISYNENGINNSNSGGTMTMNLTRVSFIGNTAGDISPDNASGTYTDIKHYGPTAPTGSWVAIGTSAGCTITYNYGFLDTSNANSVANAEIQVLGTLNFNNFVFYGGPSKKGRFNVSGAGSVTITNSIFDGWFRALTGITTDHCLLRNITESTGRVDTNVVSTADPLFVSPSTGNFHLQALSPARGAGTNLGLTADLAGRTVPNPPSVGAYEYFRGGAVTADDLTVGVLNIGP